MSFHDKMLKGLGVQKHSDAEVLTRKPTKERTVPKINDFEPNATHQMDLVYLTHDQVKNTKYRYALTVMDTATRLGDAEPMADRSAKDALVALKKIYKRGILKKPSVRITTDQGVEFKGAFNKWVKDQGLVHKYSRTGNSRQVALAEYLNYIIGKYVAILQHSKEDATGVHNREWVSKLPTIIKNYNEHVKSKMDIEAKKPSKKQLEEGVEKKMENVGSLRCKGKSCRLLEVGTKVRAIRIKPKDDVTGKRLHGGFRAGDKRWESEVRTIEKVILKAGQPPLYKVSGIDDATFTRERLQVVGEENQQINDKKKWIIEKIVKRTTKKGEIYYQIKWKGWSRKHNTEEPRENLIEDVPGMVKQYESKHPLTKAQQAKVEKTVRKSIAKRTHKAARETPTVPVRRSARIAARSQFTKKKIGQ